MSVAVTLQASNPLLPAAPTTLRTTMLPAPDNADISSGPVSQSPRKANQAGHGPLADGYAHGEFIVFDRPAGLETRIREPDHLDSHPRSPSLSLHAPVSAQQQMKV